MAIKYRISESGIQKVVEVLNDNTVVGRRKFSAKEIAVSYSGETIQIKDAFTSNVLYEGTAASFVDSNNNAFASSTGDAVLAMTNLANNIAINVTELQGLELVNDAITPDLSAYAKTTEVNTAISSAVTTAKSELQVSIDALEVDVSNLDTSVTDIDTKLAYQGNTLFSGAAVSYNFTTEETVKCKSSSQITFTTGAISKVEVIIEGIWNAYGLAQVKSYISTTNPETVPGGSTNFSLYFEGAPVTGAGSMPQWLEDYVDPGQNDQITLSNFMDTGVQGSGNIETNQVILTLSANTSYTFYLWAFTSVFGASGTNNIAISRIRVVEYID